MTSPSLTRLTGLMPPPPVPLNPPGSSDWSALEEKLGTTLPEDYKEVISTYGCGRVGDFISLLSPSSGREWDDSLAGLEQYREVIEVLEESDQPLSFGVFPARPGLIPIAQTDNGDVWFLLGGDDDPWRVAVLKSRGSDVTVYELPFSEFIYQALAGEISVLPAGVEPAFEAS